MVSLLTTFQEPISSRDIHVKENTFRTKKFVRRIQPSK
jgi:hypothetical protein